MVLITAVNAAKSPIGAATGFRQALLDMLLIQASRRVVVTAERVVDRLSEQRGRSSFISRLWVHHVMEAPHGGGLSAVFPDYRFDIPRILDYQKNVVDRAWLTKFCASA